MSNAPISGDSLETALRRLNGMIDAAVEDGGTVPPWLLAARETVRERLDNDE